MGLRETAGYFGAIGCTLKIVRLDDVTGGAAMYAKWSGRPPQFPKEVSQPMMRKLVSAANSGDASAIAICQTGACHLGRVVATIATALDSAAIMLVGPLVRSDTYREKLEGILRSSLKKEINITVSNRRGIEAACMLAISELAMSDLSKASDGVMQWTCLFATLCDEVVKTLRVYPASANFDRL